jgi:hypothetical protein
LRYLFALNSDVRFTPESDHLLRSSEMSLSANSDQSASQQLEQAFFGNSQDPDERETGSRLMQTYAAGARLADRFSQ